MTTPHVRDASPADATHLADIYNHYVATSAATFEEERVSAAEMALRVREVQGSSFPWLVAVDGAVPLGYAYARQWRARPAYRHSAETTVYIAPEHLGEGLGKRLYGTLLDQLRILRMHAVIGGIALPNDASVALHEQLGFRKVAHFDQVGFKFGRWIDVAFWQRFLDD